MEYQLNLPLIDPHWIKFNKRKRNHCILCLPGRGNHGIELARIYKLLGLNALIIGITPKNREWYPMPNGVGDQELAIEGLEPARIAVEHIVNKIWQRYGISRDKIALVGYSAGAVVGLLTSMYSHAPFGCVVSHAGAILDPAMVSECQFPECPILLAHSQDDIIFDWQERYLPMLESLQNNGYRVYTTTETNAGHGITERQFKISKRFIEESLK
jgi:phospholipase/carboxylesterase